MATITETLPNSGVETHLRAFNPRKDLLEVADLIELGFANTLDEDGQRYLEQMRQASRRVAQFGISGLTGFWSGVPTSGFVWEEDGRVVGNLSLISYTMEFRRIYLIANVVTHPDYRRRGIGRHLTAHAINYVRSLGAPAAWLHVREENETAIRLYRSLGFVERARRTTWHAKGDAPHLEIPGGLKISSPRSRDWPLQHSWLQANYPPEVTWNLPFHVNHLRPGWMGTISRLFSDSLITQWALYSGSQLLGIATWQSGPGSANLLWVSAPVQAEESAIKVLLAYARHYIPNRRTLIVDYPAHQLGDVFNATGFSLHQTLIWMEHPLIDINPDSAYT